jgi:hypothetical protein
MEFVFLASSSESGDLEEVEEVEEAEKILVEYRGGREGGDDEEALESESRGFHSGLRSCMKYRLPFLCT